MKKETLSMLSGCAAFAMVFSLGAPMDKIYCECMGVETCIFWVCAGVPRRGLLHWTYDATYTINDCCSIR